MIILFVIQEIREISLPNRAEKCLKTVLDDPLATIIEDIHSLDDVGINSLQGGRRRINS